jgi:hypothetical protein
MFRHFSILALLLLPAGVALAQNVGDACEPTTFNNSCTNQTTVRFCDSTDAQGNPQSPVIAEADCTFPDQGGTPQFPQNRCDAAGFPCTNDEGDGCTAFRLDQATCTAPVGADCIGAVVLLTPDETDDDFAFAVPCGAGGACIYDNTDGETCKSGFTACSPDSPPLACVNNTLVMCFFGLSEDSNRNNTLDAGEDRDGDGQIDSLVVSMPTGVDCASFEGGTCNNNATGGLLHEAFGITQAAPDCNIPDPAGEGEGEGEGDGDGGGGGCSDDGDCARGETCTRGRCEAREDAPACSDAGVATSTPLAGLMVLVGLAPIVRRRRR